MMLRQFTLAAMMAATAGAGWGDLSTTTDGSLSYSSSVTQRVDPGSSASVTGKISLAMTHVMDMDPSLAVLMQPETTVSITIGPDTFACLLGEDPDFETGDKSATIAKNFGPKFGVPDCPGVLKVQWGDGQLEISVISKATLILSAPAPLPHSTKAGPKSENVVTLTSFAQHPTEFIVYGYAYLASDLKLSTKAFISAEGGVNQRTTQSVKSKYLTSEPPPP